MNYQIGDRVTRTQDESWSKEVGNVCELQKDDAGRLIRVRVQWKDRRTWLRPVAIRKV